MRGETITAWIYLGFGLLTIGSLLNLLQVAGRWGRFVAVMGVVYFGIGIVLGAVHDRHMTTRARAGQGQESDLQL